MSLENLKALNLKRYQAMKVTKSYITIAKRLVAAKSRYQIVESRTNVPWSIIAVIHERESSQNWNTQLAQGDPLNRVSTHVPKGQGPYLGSDAWERAALIALEDSGGTKWGDWSSGGWTTFLEKYNGLGYANKGKPSPYVWAGTNQYTSGKYISDGVYSESAVDIQPGCVALIYAMTKLDPSINMDDLSKTTITKSTPIKETSTMFNWKTTVAGVSAIFAAIGSLFAANGTIDWTHLSTVIPAILAGLGLMFAKDSNVTGGTVAATTVVPAVPSVITVPVK